MKKAITATALSAALLAGGACTAASLYKDVQLNVDGHVQRAGGFALTVADVLAAKGVVVGERDVVTPALDAPAPQGGTVSVRYSKQVTLKVDGIARSFLTTATTLDEALLSDAVAAAPAALVASSDSTGLGGARMSVPLATPLPRDGLTVQVTTPKSVVLTVGGKRSTVTTTAATVAELLVEQGLSASGADRLQPISSTPILDDQKVTLDRVTVKKKTRTVTVAYPTVKKSNSKLWKGETRVVTGGRTGKATQTYEITVVNGKVAKKVVVAEKIVAKPVTRVVQVGTRSSGHGGGLNLARAAMWDRIARCESGGNWHINTGNGYYGGLQFNLASWRSNGGRDFAAYPHQASRAEQITVANRYYAKAGTSPWTCA